MTRQLTSSLRRPTTAGVVTSGIRTCHTTRTSLRHTKRVDVFGMGTIGCGFDIGTASLGRGGAEL